MAPNSYLKVTEVSWPFWAHFDIGNRYHASLAGASVVLVLISFYRLARRIYLQQFHPLAKFPGPKQAALSSHWLYEVSSKGSPEMEFKKLHNQYRTIIAKSSLHCRSEFVEAESNNLESHAIRIAPNELHISDVNLYKQLYSRRGEFEKDPVLYKTFGINDSIFATVHNQLHKELRSKLNPYFSHSAIVKIQSLMKESLHDWAERLELRGYNTMVNMTNFCRCYPADVITKYACGRSCGAILTSDDNFYHRILASFDASATATWPRAYHPWTRWLQDLVPVPIAARLSRNVQDIQCFIDFCGESFEAYKTGSVRPDHPVIFDALPDYSAKVISGNSVAIIAGGSDTTGFTMGFGVWHILKRPEIRKRLIAEVDELFAAMPDSDTPELVALESAPYLSAVVKESLRMAMAVPGRLPRIVPKDAKQPLIVDNKLIPPGTVVGASAYTMHSSTDIWGHDALEFIPERWLAENSKALLPYMVTFSTGNRNCIGQNLAQAELYFAFAFLFHKYDIELVADKSASKELDVVDRFTSLLDTPYYTYMRPRKVA